MWQTILRILLTATVVCLLTPPVAAGGDTGTIYLLNDIKQNSPAIPSDTDDYKVIELLDSGNCRLTDFANGYMFYFPASLAPDISLSAVRTVFSDDATRIEIYHDNVAGNGSSSWDYIEYGNRFLKNSKEHLIEADRDVWISGYPAHVTQWSRRKLARIENDKNYYACAEIVKSPAEVYTILVKSSLPIENAQEIFAGFSLIDRQGVPHNYKELKPSATVLDEESRAFYSRYFSIDGALQWGIFEPNAPDFPDSLRQMEAQLHYHFPFVIRYQSLDEHLPVRGLQQAYADGKFVELTLQTVHADVVDALKADSAGHSNASMLYDILDGKYDDYFTEYAQQIKAFGHPVLFRLNNEMNGDWCWYSAYYTGKDTEIYQAAWRYIHAIFDRNGVHNVLWVWNPNDLSLPSFQWNHYLMYYPGDEWVDIIGLTGYNTGTYFPGERWREFDEIYTAIYREYSVLFNKPFMITEFACNSVGGDKAAWMERMFSTMGRFPKIKVAVWWSGIDYDKNGQPGRIYRLDESDAVMNVFRTHAANSHDQQ